MAGFFSIESWLKALLAGKPGIPSTAGEGMDVSLPNNRTLYWRNAADNADVAGITVNASDQVVIGGWDSGTATATGTGATGTATLSKKAGLITSEALTTAAAGTYTLTLTNTKITAASIILAQARIASATTGTPMVTKVTAGSGSVVIVVTNIAAAAALNGTIEVAFQIVG